MKLSAVASLAVVAPRAFAASRRKPNLLFIWTDEQRADTMAAYGNRKIRVPNLNRLASKSVVFEKAYVTQPVCSPSRATVMTGLWPHASGILKNNIPLAEATPCFPELLGDPDYRCAYMGKWHLGDEIFAQHGFEQWVSIEDNYIQYYSSERDKKARSDYHHYLLSLGLNPGRGNRFSRSFAAGLPIERCKPKFLERSAIDFMKRLRKEPFLLYVNFLEPHMPFTGPLNDLHDPDEVDLPPNFDDPLEENEPEKYIKKRASCAKKYGTTKEDFRRLIARYWGLMSQVDRSIGAILDALDNLGLADDTIVVHTSDHGDMMGAHRMVEKGVMYEESARVPWLMRVPWIGRKQRLIKRPVSHIDLVPTLLDLMGRRSAGAKLPGKSLAPLMRGEELPEDDVFIQWNGDVTTRTVVSADGWKLCLSQGDKCQLFDLKEDPYEMTNLFDSGRHEATIVRLAHKIRAWQKKVGDAADVFQDLGK
jgi:choline-sulfatase